MLKRILAFALLFAVMLTYAGNFPATAGAAQDYLACSDEFLRALSELVEESLQDAGPSVISMTAGETVMYVDGEPVELETAPLVDGEEVSLPLEELAEAIGAEMPEDGGEPSITGTDEPWLGHSPGMAKPPSGSVVITSPDGITTEMRPDGSIVMKRPVSSATVDEISDKLGVEVHISGDSIVVTRPFQLKQIIVRLKGGKSLASQHGAVKALSGGSGLYVLQYATEDEAKRAADAFSRDSSVYSAEPNIVVRAEAAAFWSSQAIRADKMINKLTADGKTSQNLVVAVVDSGIMTTHVFFANRLTSGFNFIEYGEYMRDGHMHGTHVSGTVVDCTPPNVKVMPIRVMDDSGSGTELTIALGVRYAADHGAKVINMSLGAHHSWRSCVLEEAMEYAVAKGVTVVAAAGNDAGDADTHCPSKSVHSICVAAVDADDEIAYFSNYGETVDIAAPGVDISSAYNTGITAYTSVSGTSMASPHVAAGAALLLLNNPSLSPAQVKTAVRATAVDLGPPGWDMRFGMGRLDFRLLFGTTVPATGITLSPASIQTDYSTLRKTLKLTKTVTPADATDKSITFTSSDESVVKIADGEPSLNKPGNAVITGRIKNGASATCDVTAAPNWLEFAAPAFDGGNGTQSNPYRISTAEQLAKLSYDYNVLGILYKGEYFVLTADIDLAGKEWTPIESVTWVTKNMKSAWPFSGNFDGKYHEIKNMRIDRAYAASYWDGYGLGLFAGIYEGHVKNLAVTDAVIKGHHNGSDAIASSPLSGNMAWRSVIENCYSSGGAVGNVGLVEALYRSEMRNCFSTSDSDYAGLVGASYNSLIVNSWASGRVTDTNPNLRSGGFMYASSSYRDINGPLPQQSRTINCFSAGDAASNNGFAYYKYSGGSIDKSYYLDTPNARGILIDESPASTDLNPRPMTFFTDPASYQDGPDWNPDYPWDFERVWGINGGLPYLRRFVEPVTEEPTAYPDPDTAVLKGDVVTLSCGTPGAAIYYTVDGSQPTEDSAVYSEPIVLERNTVIRAFARAAGSLDSDEAVFEYIVNQYRVRDVDETDGFYIDLDRECLMTGSGYSVAAYSIDGGAKWKKGAPKIPSLLNKPLRLVITDGYHPKTKAPLEAAATITFPPIEARPKSNPDRLKINYSIFADPSGLTPGAWTLAKPGAATASADGLEYAPQSGKTLAEPWNQIGADGVPFSIYHSRYMIRYAPVIDVRIVPASKPFKVTVANRQKAKSSKANYAAETIALKANMMIFAGSYEELMTADVVYAPDAASLQPGQFYMAAGKVNVSISAILDAADGDDPPVVCIWIAATEKKPATLVNQYTLAKRAKLAPRIIPGHNGKAILGNEYEVYDGKKDKWGKLPKFTESVRLEHGVRLKPTRKSGTGTNDFALTAASRPADMIVEYGVYTPDGAPSPKSGVLRLLLGGAQVDIPLPGNPPGP